MVSMENLKNLRCSRACLCKYELKKKDNIDNKGKYFTFIKVYSEVKCHIIATFIE